VKEFLKCVLLALLAVGVFVIGDRLTVLIETTTHAVAAVPTMVDKRIAAVQTDLNRQLDATRDDLNRQLTAVRKDSVQQITQTRTEALAAIGSIKDTADARLASIQGDAVKQLAAVTDPLHATLAAVADTTPMFTDCDHNPDCLFNRYQGASKAFERASMETAKTMQAVQAGTPAIVASVTKAANNAAEASANSAKVTANLAVATKPLPKWARIGLAAAPPLAQTAYTMTSMWFLVH
jgi:hypothetical protein